MTSTVLDATLALLLLSAAVVTVVSPTAPADDTASRADATLETLATSTATVDYTLAPGARNADASLVKFPRTSGPEFRRTSHGTLEELLVRVTRPTVTVDGERVTRTGNDLRTAVRAAVARAIGPRTQVVAVWQPYPDSYVRSRFAVGAEPPRDATVHAASLTLPIASPGSDGSWKVTPGDGYSSIARETARKIVVRIFPPNRTNLALGGDYPLASLVAYRYSRFAALHGVDVSEALERRDAEAVNRALVGPVTERVEDDLRQTFDSPAEAASAVRGARVRIVVRTWS